MRYERKYRVDALSVEWVKQVLRMHPAGFRPLFPDRRVNNVYFDTPDLQAFYQNINGVPQRRKYRLRWYGDELDTLTDSVLEVKIKDGEVGYKENYPQGHLRWKDLPDWADRQPLLHSSALRPVLVNAYQRSYLGAYHGRFRLTIDWNLHYGPFRPVPPTLHPWRDAAAIIELKYAAEDEADAADIWRHLPFRQTKNSKYVTGVQLIR